MQVIMLSFLKLHTENNRQYVMRIFVISGDAI